MASETQRQRKISNKTDIVPECNFARRKRFENLEILSAGIRINKYDIPVLTPLSHIEDNTKFVSFNVLRTLKQKNGYGVHFFIDDYQFERLWQRPEVYIKMLRECKYVFTPDFSLYVDAPYAVQLWKHYQKQWFGRYMQSSGILTIPTLGWSDERSFEFCFEGIPSGGIVAVSSVGTQNSSVSKHLFKQGFEKAIEILTPSTILFFGQIPAEIDISGLNIVHYPHSFDVKFKAMRDGR